MKSVLDQSTRDELISRIQSIDQDKKARWGKMNLYQMLHHCVLCEELYLGKTKHKRVFMGRIFGKIGLKKILDESKAFRQNAPTSEMFIVKEQSGHIEAEKEKWIDLINEYKTYPGNYVHWFFGKMTREQVGLFVYKHDDHHLRQFGA